MITPAQHLKKSIKIIPSTKAVAILIASICHTAKVSLKYSENLSVKNSLKNESLNSYKIEEFVMASVLGRQYLSKSIFMLKNFKITLSCIISKRSS